MPINTLLNQSITIITAQSLDEWGDATGGTTSTIRARFVDTVRELTDDNGETLTSDAIIYVPKDTTVNAGDKLSYDGVDYTVIYVERARNRRGGIHHKELLVQRQ